MKIKSSTKSLLVAIAEVLVIFGVCDLSNICMHYFMLKSDVYSLYLMVSTLACGFFLASRVVKNIIEWTVKYND